MAAPTAAPDTTTTTTTTPTVVPDLSGIDGSHDLFAHYVLRGPVDVTDAYVLGLEVTALCGKVWVPTRDPERFPLCPTCAELAAARRARSGQ